VISSPNGQARPAAANRFSVSRTVDGTTPVRKAIWCFDTPAYPKVRPDVCPLVGWLALLIMQIEGYS
jgi:hypothetical protein